MKMKRRKVYCEEEWITWIAWMDKNQSSFVR